MYFANELYVSEDGQSSFAEAKYVVSQKSIWTFYELDPAKKPFGIETVSEEEVQGENVVSGTNSNPKNWEGRTSAVSNNRDKGFYADLTKNTGKQDIYKGAYKACMSRNRDENGNGTIDENEIKWYLAAVDQYKGMWAGEGALDTDMRLFKADKEDWDKLKSSSKQYHYFTCSAANTFWAEEGCATGNENNSAKVRCIRTLESKAEGLKDAEKYYEYDPATETMTMLLNADALRSEQLVGFETYFERGKTNNLLYKKFKVASENLPGSYKPGYYKKEEVISKTKGKDFIAASDDVCQKAVGYAWRVPNQRELAVMSAQFGGSLGNLFSCTSFTGVQENYYKFNDAQAYGFVTTTAHGTDIPIITVAVEGDKSYGVRCVMDVVD